MNEHIVYRSKFEKEADEFWFDSAVNVLAWFLSNPLWTVAIVAGLICTFVILKKKRIIR